MRRNGFAPEIGSHGEGLGGGRKMGPMYAVGLYMSGIQPCDIAGLDRAEIAGVAEDAIAAYGERGCAIRLAMQYWECPSAAAARMQWALDVVRRCRREGTCRFGILSKIRKRVVQALAVSGPDEAALLHAILPVLAAAAGTDDLTGVATRQRLMYRLATSRSRITEVVVIDINYLKIINDGPGGHAAGDRLLQSAARAIHQASGEEDLVARTGGDEFAVFVSSDPNDQDMRIEERIRCALRRCGVSAAVGTGRVYDGDVETAWNLADRLMYNDKHIHRARASNFVT